MTPRIERSLGLRPYLILQGAILSGGILSILVLLLIEANVARQLWLGGHAWGATTAALLDGLAVLPCILALMRLRNSEQYLPRSLPNFVSQRIYGGFD